MQTIVRRLLGNEKSDGRPAGTAWSMAILLGTTIAELGKWVDPYGDTAAAVEKLPVWLIQQGRRRSREAQAATGTGAVAVLLTFWAIRDYGAGVLGFEFVAGGANELWMICTPEVADRILGETEAS